MKKVQVVMLACLLAFGLMFVGCGEDDTSPSGVTKQYYKALKKLDKDKIRELAAPKIADFIIALMETDEVKKSAGKIGDPTVSEEKIDGEYATVKVTYTDAEGKQKTDKVQLMKMDGKWKVASAK